jgi:hypothetical protein
MHEAQPRHQLSLGALNSIYTAGTQCGSTLGRIHTPLNTRSRHRGQQQVDKPQGKHPCTDCRKLDHQYLDRTRQAHQQTKRSRCKQDYRGPKPAGGKIKVNHHSVRRKAGHMPWSVTCPCGWYCQAICVQAVARSTCSTGAVPAQTCHKPKQSALGTHTHAHTPHREAVHSSIFNSKQDGNKHTATCPTNKPVNITKLQ